MAKDPAVLFYTQDFITGTLLMTYEQKGKYITLLCLQQQNGRLSESDLMKVCGGFDMTCLELDEEYFKAGVQRVQNHMRQLDMFIERPELIIKSVKI